MNKVLGIVVATGIIFITGSIGMVIAIEKGTMFYVPGTMSATVYEEGTEKIIGNVHVKSVVPVIDDQGDYYKIVVDGWVEKKQIKILIKKKEYGKEDAITTKETELLDMPLNLSGKEYCAVRKGVKLYIQEDKGDWAKVRFYGWTNKSLLVEDSKRDRGKASKAKMKPIEIIKWNWRNVGNSIMVDGIVKNNSENTYHYLKLRLSIKDINDAFLGEGESFIGRDEFKPGAQASFTAYIDGATTDSTSIKISYEWESADEETGK